MEEKIISRRIIKPHTVNTSKAITVTVPLREAGLYDCETLNLSVTDKNRIIIERMVTDA